MVRWRTGGWRFVRSGHPVWTISIQGGLPWQRDAGGRRRGPDALGTAPDLVLEVAASMEEARTIAGRLTDLARAGGVRTVEIRGLPPHPFPAAGEGGDPGGGVAAGPAPTGGRDR